MVVKVANRLIGRNKPVFIVAEAGVNHNGSVRLAEKLIETAKLCGADAVKFQNWKTDEITTGTVTKPTYQSSSDGDTQAEVLRKLELPERSLRHLAAYAKQIGILFASTPEGKEPTDFICSLGVPFIKVGSGDLTNHPHLAHVSMSKKPIMMSTGMATLDEVKSAVDVVEAFSNSKVMLLHCTTAYPCPLNEVNLRAMLTLRDTFAIPVGYSDHTLGIGVSVLAALLGATIVEKHLTLEKDLPGPDHSSSLTPEEFTRLVLAIRYAEQIGPGALKARLEGVSRRFELENRVLSGVEEILGDSAKGPTPSERMIMRLVRKYIVAAKDIERGDTITSNDLAIKRCGGGLDPKFMGSLPGLRARVAIKKDTPITIGKLKW